MYKGTPAGNPTQFTEMDGLHRPTDPQRIGGVDCRLGASGIIQCIYQSNGNGNAVYVTFNTATDLWETKEVTAPINGQSSNRFQSRVALAIDANEMPHVIYPNANNGGLSYANRTNGAWSTGFGLTTATDAEHPSLTFDRTGVF